MAECLPDSLAEMTLKMIGDRWKVLIIQNLMDGTKRFGELKKELGDITQKVLTSNLRLLEEKGILTSRGKTTWSKRSIETMLTNEKYVGDVILYKTFSPNFPEKKRIQNNGEHKKYLQEDHHPAIISREMFRAVQEMRESRSNIERHADGTVTRKARRYTGKKE